MSQKVRELKQLAYFIESLADATQSMDLELELALRATIKVCINRTSLCEDRNKVTDEEIEAAKTNKVTALKMYRTRTGAGLAEAKSAIESKMIEKGIE